MPPTTLYKQLDTGLRIHTAFDLEKILVAFITQLFTDTYLLDNPAVNELQQPNSTSNPDLPPVSYDYTKRAQTLAGKVPVQVVRGRVPRTVTGDIDPTALPNFPSITVQAISGHVGKLETQIITHVVVRIFLHAYDENPNSQGYQDLINMIEVIVPALTSYGQKSIGDAYPIVLPIEWKIPDSNIFPHFFAEMHSTWMLPTARPLPDYDDLFPMIPAEHLEVVSEPTTLWNGL